VILSDWLWVARERSLGRDLLFSPHSTALGAVMAKDAKSFTQPSDFIGKKLGVAGGPLDKSWLLLQAWALKKGVDLKAQATLVFGAPPLLAEKLAQGELDAALEFWTFCARLEARGFARAVDMADVERELGARGPVIITGYVFTPVYAAQHGAALNRFLVMMTEARKQLAGDEALFAKIAPSTGPLLAGAPDAATLAIFRRAYRAGLPDRPLEEYQTDAAALYKVLAQIGGPQLVGPATELDPKIFFSAP
jgi:NitT/TauT family transport system substrate-binding protein